MTDVVALRAFVDELVQAGLTDAVVCPGSRSTPLALALRAHPGMRVRVLLDERSAGFFAIGLARASRAPVAVLTTSGTAAANLLPAAVEASLARVPLVLLTADRPAELRDRGAQQAIDQVHLFGSHVRWFAELPLLDGTSEVRRHVRGVAGRAVATAMASPAGPVHLNLPFREPLVPNSDLAPPAAAVVSLTPSEPGRHPFVAVAGGARVLSADVLDGLARRFAGVGRGLIVAGPQDDPAVPAAIASLAAATGWPIFADPLSGVRCGPHDRTRVLARGDLLLRPGPWVEAHRPDVVVRFGAQPVSKAYLTALQAWEPDHAVVDGDAGWREPALLRTTFVHADAVATAAALASGLAGGGVADAAADGWLSDWLAADRAVDAAARGWLEAIGGHGEAFEGLPFAALGDLLPDGALLWAGNSMPVRDLDDWLPSTDRAIRVLANRGANGIDGVVSTALGSAAVPGAGPVALVVGDLSFLHDLNALVAARLHGLAATIVLVANDGGGIFSFLSQADAAAPGVGLPERFEELFGTPHGIDLGPIVTALGGDHQVVTAADLAGALTASIGAPGVQVLELRTTREHNVALHREVGATVAAALAGMVGPARAAGAAGTAG